MSDALDILTEMAPDVRIINLETAVTRSDNYWPDKGIHYRMHPKNVSCLTAAKIDCCVLANNHVLDWGYAGWECQRLGCRVALNEDFTLNLHWKT